MLNIFNLADLKRAGRARLRKGTEFAEWLIDPKSEETPEQILMRKGLGRIMGGSEQILLVTASPAALAAAAATYIGPLIGIPEQPLVMAFHYCPTVTGATAAATLTFTMRRTDTPATIGTQSFLTATADTNPRGPVFFCVVPFGIPAANGVDVQGAASAGAGTLTASATSPLVLAVLGVN